MRVLWAAPTTARGVNMITTAVQRVARVHIVRVTMMDTVILARQLVPVRLIVAVRPDYATMMAFVMKERDIVHVLVTVAQRLFVRQLSTMA